MEQQPAKKRLTAAQVKAREERLRAAGITIGRQGTSVITLLARRAPVDEPLGGDGSGEVRCAARGRAGYPGS